MEASQPLSIESFSYSWLVNLKPSMEGVDSSVRASLDASDEASFIEMDPRLPPSKRFIRISSSSDFNFDFPMSQSTTPFPLAHADEIFSNGYVLPIFANQSKMEKYRVSDFTCDQVSTCQATKNAIPGSKLRCSSLRRCQTFSKQIFGKYFHFLRPLYQIIRNQKSNSKAEAGSRRAQGVKSWVYPADSSPRMSAHSVDDWRKSCDSESSIYEAVLHCKRSIGMQTLHSSSEISISVVL